MAWECKTSLKAAGAIAVARSSPEVIPNPSWDQGLHLVWCGSHVDHGRPNSNLLDSTHQATFICDILLYYLQDNGFSFWTHTQMKTEEGQADGEVEIVI